MTKMKRTIGGLHNWHHVKDEKTKKRPYLRGEKRWDDLADLLNGPWTAGDPQRMSSFFNFIFNL
ncbi:hypothetical protein PsorP6_009918 [Peronosclerospora sorghi]|uniref:Uncharacterized protein n=1 Tax=Peronosclerospora sorghi TaxID=230839 RepID=A0ACC0VTY8_9STRA|nr:hypothetical protein PsorP6_009918 [Peronosclerospora sorghi]